MFQGRDGEEERLGREWGCRGCQSPGHVRPLGPGKRFWIVTVVNITVIGTISSIIMRN